MRLLQASKAYSPHIGGVETVVQQVAEGAASAGWDSAVLVASEDREGAHERIRGVSVDRVPTLARPLSLPIAPGYRRALRRSEADVLIVHEPTLLAAMSMFGRHASFRERFARIIVWWHSDVVRQRAMAAGYGPVLRHLLDAADDIIVATPHHISSSSYLPRFADKVSVIPFGVDLDAYRSSEARDARVAELRRALPRVPIVAYVGRLARYKGMPVFGEAMDRVRQAHFVIVGSGPCERAITGTQAYREGRVTCLAHLDKAGVIDLLTAADIFVLPSTQVSEAFGIVQIEAMACATPVVTFDLPTGVTWVNRHGETGLVARLGDPISLADAIAHLVEDDELRTRLGRQARQRVESTFTQEQMIRSVLELCGRDNAVVRR